MNSYQYDQNGNMTDRYIAAGPDAGTYEFEYDAENRMVRAEKNSALIGQFFYDADGKQVKTIVDGVTTSYVGNHYEVKDGAVTKYYFAGTTRLAVRHGTTLNYLLSDHLGSSSVTTDENGIQTAQAMYKTFGETRYFIGDLKTHYTFTGQREEASLGLYFFVARWLDPSLGRFTSPDTIVPTSTQGTQAWDRYAFVNNNPVRYTDPTGHSAAGEDGGGGESEPRCMDPKAKNYRAYGSCEYPDPKDEHHRGEYRGPRTNISLGAGTYTMGCASYFSNADGTPNQWNCTEINTYVLFSSQEAYIDFLSSQQNAPYTMNDFQGDFASFAFQQVIGLADPFGIGDTLTFFGDVSGKAGSNQSAALNFALDQTFSRGPNESSDVIMIAFFDYLYQGNRATSVVMSSRGSSETYYTQVSPSISNSFQAWLWGNVPYIP
ncbi:MAG: hypothetical protein HFACDABA_02351 [Anaerolineales bacterium]|nr:hypothetical protein [Anaerolineales bacterium]